MIELSGLVPGRDIAIEVVGRRPGEKLHEQLFNPDERPQPTPAERILRAERSPLSPELVDEAFAEIGLLVPQGDAAALAAKVGDLHPRTAPRPRHRSRQRPRPATAGWKRPSSMAPSMTLAIAAISVSEQIEKYGAYAGLAAIVGLGVLSLLYSRRRARSSDCARAGRAPERAVELSRVAADAARRTTVSPLRPQTAAGQAAALASPAVETPRPRRGAGVLDRRPDSGRRPAGRRKAGDPVAGTAPGFRLGARRDRERSRRRRRADADAVPTRRDRVPGCDQRRSDDAPRRRRRPSPSSGRACPAARRPRARHRPRPPPRPRPRRRRPCSRLLLPRGRCAAGRRRARCRWSRSPPAIAVRRGASSACSADPCSSWPRWSECSS